MNWFTGCAIYLTTWWTVLFAILPIGTRPVAEADSATGWRGAPAAPRMGQKVLWTTLVSAVIWLVIYWLIVSDWVSFRHGFFALHEN